MKNSSGDDPQVAQVTVVGEDSILLKEDHLQDFLVVSDCLVTCAELKHGWTLSVYQMKMTTRSVNGGVENAATDIPCCQRSPVYRTYFPKSDTSQRTNLLGCLNMMNYHTDQSNTDQSTNHRPCLKCIMSNTTKVKPETGSTPNKLLVLEDVLFNDLFGSESNLLDSPCVVLGLPDGRIYQVALKSLRNEAEESSVTKNNSEVSGLTGNMLYHLQDPIINIHTVHDVIEPHGSQCLVLLGSRGKVVTISHSQQETSKRYDEHSVAGPVVSSCATKSHIIYCTQRALFTLSISQVRDGSERSSGRREKCAIASSSLGVGRVCDLDVLKPREEKSKFVPYSMTRSVSFKWNIFGGGGGGVGGRGLVFKGGYDALTWTYKMYPKQVFVFFCFALLFTPLTNNQSFTRCSWGFHAFYFITS